MSTIPGLTLHATNKQGCVINDNVVLEENNKYDLVKKKARGTVRQSW
jgi:hypothetical protein